MYDKEFSFNEIISFFGNYDNYNKSINLINNEIEAAKISNDVKCDMCNSNCSFDKCLFYKSKKIFEYENKKYTIGFSLYVSVCSECSKNEKKCIDFINKHNLQSVPITTFYSEKKMWNPSIYSTVYQELLTPHELLNNTLDVCNLIDLMFENKFNQYQNTFNLNSKDILSILIDCGLIKEL